MNNTYPQCHWYILCALHTTRKFANRFGLASYIITKYLKTHIGTKHNLFDCGQNSLISQNNVCDGVDDCPGPMPLDENDCNCSVYVHRMNITTESRFAEVNKSAAHVGLLLNRKINESCLVHGYENLAIQNINQSVFKCTDNTVKPLHCANDLIADCSEGEDEQNLKLLLVGKSNFKCAGNRIACMPGHSKCYNFSDICVYKLNRQGHLVACRNGGHVQECSFFQCNTMFKCPKYYCVPWNYLCNGKWDCPGGSDESHKFECEDTWLMCRGMFKCRNTHSSSCIHVGRVCDSQEDCMFGDDELLCEVGETKCPDSCTCLALAFSCVNKTDHLPILRGLHNFKYAFIVFSPDILSEISFLKCIEQLHLISNKLTEICDFTESLTELVIFDVRFNFVQILKTKCFNNLPHLQDIDISHNKIETIASHSFGNLPNLRKINLARNLISNLPSRIFTLAIHVDCLNFRGNKVTQFTTETLYPITLKRLELSTFHLCCAIPQEAQCLFTSKPWFLSCSNLLKDKTARVSILTVSLLVCLANIICICIHLYFYKRGTAFNIVTLAVNSTDIICSFYLLGSGVADVYYDRTYIMNDLYWRSSVACFSLFFLAMTFSVSSPSCLLLMSVCRMQVVQRPFDSKVKDKQFVSLLILYSFLPLLFLSLFLTLVTFLLHGTVPTALCLPFVDPTDTYLIFELITWIVSFLQLSVSVAILVLYVKIIQAVIESKKNLRIRSTAKRSETPIIVQLVIITFSNIMCWLPSSGIFLTSLLISQYPIVMVTMTTIVVMPINSLVNPIVFVVSTLRKSMKL